MTLYLLYCTWFRQLSFQLELDSLNLYSERKYGQSFLSHEFYDNFGPVSLLLQSQLLCRVKSIQTVLL